MQVRFKSPVSIDGVLFRKGTHEVPDKFAKHWYLLALVQNGVAFIVEEPKQDDGKHEDPPVPPAPSDDPEKALSYHDHMAKWESKADKKAEGKPAAKKKRKSRAKPKPEEKPEGT